MSSETARCVNAVLQRFETELPYKKGGEVKAVDDLSTENRRCVISLSSNHFQLVLAELTSTLKNVTRIGSTQTVAVSADSGRVLSELIVLETLRACLETQPQGKRAVETRTFSILLPCIAHLIDSSESAKVRAVAARTLTTLSADNFDQILARIHPCLLLLAQSSEDSLQFGNITLIQHIDVDAVRLRTLIGELSRCFKSLKRAGQYCVCDQVQKAIWNWIEHYPTEYNEFLKTQDASLSGSAVKLFDEVEQFANSDKRRNAVWRLQILLLFLCPNIVLSFSAEEIDKTNYDDKVLFLYKAVSAMSSSNRMICDAGVQACVNVCRLCSYVNRLDTPVVKYFVTMFQSKLQDILFDSKKLYMQQSVVGIPKVQVPDEQEARMHCFMALFRINYRNNYLANVCFHSDAPLLFKVVIVKAMRRIIDEGVVVPWWPGAYTLYPFADQLRKLLQSCVDWLKKRQAATTGTPSRSRTAALDRKSLENQRKLHLELGGSLLELFLSEPQCALHNSTDGQPNDRHELLKLFSYITSLVQHPTFDDLSSIASEVLLQLTRHESMETWNPENSVPTVWEVSSQVIFSIGMKFTSHKAKNLLSLIQILQAILMQRNCFLLDHQADAFVGSDMEMCQQAQTVLEVVMLTSLCSSNVEIVQTALKCLQQMCDEVDIKGSMEDVSDMPVDSNLTTYRDLGDLARAMPTGRVAQQKKILHLLRQMAEPTPGNSQAWEDTFTQWQASTLVLKSQSKELESTGDSIKSVKPRQTQSPPAVSQVELQTQFLDWLHMTGFLCALGGLLMPQRRSSRPTSLPDFTSLLSSRRSDSLGGLSISKLTSNPLIKKFINEIVGLLVCSSDTFGLEIRENVRDLLGHELHPAFYPIVYQEITDCVRAFSPNTGQVTVNDRNTLFVEQVLSVGKMMLETELDSAEDYFLFSSLETTVITLARYARSLDLSHKSLVVKFKFCQMVDAILRRRGELTFNHEIRFRNKLLEYVSDWVMTSNGSEHGTDSISRDVDLASVRTLANLLEGLPLHPEETESDLAEEKSKLFLKYFTLLTNLLADCQDDGVLSSVQRDMLSYSATISRHIVAIRQHAITAVANLLNANLETGLVHALGLAYTEDPQTRATFMEVLTATLKQGTEFGTLSETVLMDRYEKMVDIVLTEEDGQMPILLTLLGAVPPSQLDDLIEVVLGVVESRHLLCQFAKPILTEEVENTESVQTLFRGNSLASKVIAGTFKAFAGGFLHTVVKPIIEVFIETRSDQGLLGYEVDPSRLPDGEDIERNQKNLVGLAQKVFDDIIDMSKSLPIQIHVICHCLYEAVAGLFPGRELNAVCSAFFLRFINPALVLPGYYGLSQGDLNRSSKRTVVLLSKLLQNLANNVEFKKEQFMFCFNKFLSENASKADSLAQHLAELPSKPVIVVDEPAEVEADVPFVKETDKLLLHELLWSQQEVIKNDLFRVNGKLGKRLYEPLATLLAQLGQPDSKLLRRRGFERTLTRLDAVSSPMEEYLVTTGTGIDQEQMDDMKKLKIFYRDGKSRAGNPVCYYVARKFKPDFEHQHELLLYHILLTVKSLLRRPWELLIDLTEVRRESAPKIEYLSKLVRVIPSSMAQNLVVLYVYNCNTWARHYFRHVDRLLSKVKGNKKVVFLDNLQKLHEFIDPSDLKLSSSTTSYEETTRVFAVASKLSTRSIPTTIKVCSQSFQVIVNEKVRVLGQSVLIVDSYHISELEEATILDGNTLSLKTTDGMPTMKFTSADAGDLLSGLNHLHNRWSLSQTGTPGARKTIRPGDVPGTLLNMALLNLGSSDPSLRLAAYNLLCTLTSHFHLQIERELTEAQGVCIPGNNTIFIKTISGLLASNEPHLTLEFLEESITGFQSSDGSSKSLCLEFIAPWLPNLARFISREQPDEQKASKVKRILEKLILLTVAEKESQMYPSIQAHVWGTIGQVPELLDPLLVTFLKTSAGGGLGSDKVEVIADTTVSLATSNKQLVSSKVVKKLLKLIGRTWNSPTRFLEQHILWEEAAILVKFLLMLSFNDRLDVVHNLPHLFHIVTLLSSIGPVFVRASVHGLVCNVIHSLCTRAEELQLKESTVRALKVKLSELSQPKFHLWFGISKVKSSAVAAFQPAPEDKMMRSLNSLPRDESEIAIVQHIESISSFLYETVQLCVNDMVECTWIAQWRQLVERAMYQYNPPLQPRALVTYGVLADQANEDTVSHLLKILCEFLDKFCDEVLLVKAVLMCLTRVVIVLCKDSRYPPILFWVAVSCLQLTSEDVFASALALLEATLQTMDVNGAFDKQTAGSHLMSARKAYDLYFSQLDRVLGISFTTNFDFALACILMKGLFHPSPLTATRTVQLLQMMVSISGKKYRQKKDDVVAENLPYLTVLFPKCDESRFLLLCTSASKFSTSGSKRSTLRVRASCSFGTLSSFGNPGALDDDLERPHVSLLVDKNLASNQTSQHLLLFLLIQLFLHSTNEKELEHLLYALADIAKAFSSAFLSSFGLFVSKMEDILQHTQNPILLKAVREMLEACCGSNSETVGKESLVNATLYLNEIGFSGLIQFQPTFDKGSQSDVTLQLIRKAITAIVKLATVDELEFFLPRCPDLSIPRLDRSRLQVRSIGSRSPEPGSPVLGEIRSAVSLGDVSVPSELVTSLPARHNVTGLLGESMTQWHTNGDVRTRSASAIKLT
ncbi:neurofibromin-like isoform X2 [Corticium candelabrum]|uniref:neurofibromin-like isoform X2 n=1 Tax=Corticium candelabrum TaxID=121492 RepID=UPI002E25F3A9|nr:neurofibromin-like isoform X2 [Corticium candelabrum]